MHILTPSRRAGPVLALVLIGLSTDPAAARAAPPAPVAPAPAPAAAAWTAGTGGDCTRTRRKLWQAGEGWIVKAITTCR